MKNMIISAIVVLVLCGSTMAAVTAYTDEAAFLEDLAVLGYSTIIESFECDTWIATRSSVVGGFHTSPSMLSQRITWTANDVDSTVTTGSGAAITGNWGFYSYPHNPDGDGFIGTGEVILYGVGGWFDTNTPPAELGLIIDGDELNPVDFGEICEYDEFGEPFNCVDLLLWTAPQFYGVINTDGFAFFEFRELEGVPGDQKLLFADDFTFAVATDPLVAGDLNGDGAVDILDIAILAQYWLQDFSSVPLAPPSDGHCSVGMIDFAILSQNWLTGDD